MEIEYHIAALSLLRKLRSMKVTTAEVTVNSKKPELTELWCLFTYGPGFVVSILFVIAAPSMTRVTSPGWLQSFWDVIPVLVWHVPVSKLSRMIQLFVRYENQKIIRSIPLSFVLTKCISRSRGNNHFDVIGIRCHNSSFTRWEICTEII